MTMGQRVQLPNTTEYPITLSCIGGDPDRSRVLKGGKTHQFLAADRDELQAFMQLGAVLLADDTPDGPATAEPPA
jgi:hypothetical protein